MSNISSICVIIAAYNAEATIGDAVASALSQSVVTEVVVVDDASTDHTCAMAEAAAVGDARLKVVRMQINGGVSTARNRGIAESTSPFIAILDADDYYLEDRFEGLIDRSDWDLFADNIAFVPDTTPGLVARSEVAEAMGETRLDLAGFAEGNLSARSVDRGELGFLKPVMRRSFLEANELLFDETLRFGEDFDFYVRILIAGGQFSMSHRVGYVARVRAGSLSGTHSAGDLERFLAAAEHNLGQSGLDVSAKRALERHSNELRRRFELREFLRLRGTEGPAKAVQFALWPCRRAMAIAQGVFRDKTARFRRRPDEVPTLRYLLPVHDGAGRALAKDTSES